MKTRDLKSNFSALKRIIIWRMDPDLADYNPRIRIAWWGRPDWPDGIRIPPQSDLLGALVSLVILVGPYSASFVQLGRLDYTHCGTYMYIISEIYSLPQTVAECLIVLSTCRSFGSGLGFGFPYWTFVNMCFSFSSHTTPLEWRRHVQGTRRGRLGCKWRRNFGLDRVHATNSTPQAQP